MKLLGEKFNRFLRFLLIALTLHLASSQAYSQITAISSPQAPDGSAIAVFILVQTETNADEITNLPPLLSVTHGSNSVPFEQLYSSYTENLAGIATNFVLYQAGPITVATEVLTDSITLIWTNFSTNLSLVYQPFFSLVPTNEPAFVGTTAALSAMATHTTGFQWQHAGTNLLADGHFFGVTDSILTISNLQIADAGLYTVIANHPLNPGTESATLSVYKPIELGLLENSAANSFTLTIANQDGSPFESDRVTNLQIFSITSLSADDSSWNEETNTGGISNGIFQITFPDDGSPEKFWRVLEQ